MYRTVFTSVVLASMVFFLGCDDEPKTVEVSEQAPAEQEPSDSAGTSTATLMVSADKTHAVQPGDEVTVTVEVAGFILDGSGMGQANREGVGHYSVYLDDTSTDPIAVSADPTVKVKIPEDITDGSHDVLVVLQNNDSTPLTPSVQGSVLLIVYRL